MKTILIVLLAGFVSLAHAERYAVITTERPASVRHAIRQHMGVSVNVKRAGNPTLGAMVYRTSSTIRYPEFQCAGQWRCVASGPRWFLAEAVAYAFGCAPFDSRATCRRLARIHNEVEVQLGRRQEPWCLLNGFVKDSRNYVTAMECYEN